MGRRLPRRRLPEPLHLPVSEPRVGAVALVVGETLGVGVRVEQVEGRRRALAPVRGDAQHIVELGRPRQVGEDVGRDAPGDVVELAVCQPLLKVVVAKLEGERRAVAGHAPEDGKEVLAGGAPPNDVAGQDHEVGALGGKHAVDDTQRVARLPAAVVVDIGHLHNLERPVGTETQPLRPGRGKQQERRGEQRQQLSHRLLVLF